MLQETHINKKSDIVLETTKYLLQYQVFSTTKSRRIAILISNKVCFTLKDMMTDLSGRFIFTFFGADFGTISGLQINQIKTEFFPIYLNEAIKNFVKKELQI